MEHGVYYHARLKLPFRFLKREVRVWLPDSYDFHGTKRYPVLYMSDGQNLVDKYLTKFGDWHLDRVVEELKKQGYPEPILVGIDSPKGGERAGIKRANELNPPFTVDLPEGPQDPIGDQFVNFICDTLKPMIDKMFFTLSDKKATGIGGSSMGGIMAFYAYLARPDIFGFSMSFSIPFFFYKEERLKSIIDSFKPSSEKNGLLAMYVGGKDSEKMFVKGTRYVRQLLEKDYGFDEDSLFYQEDLTQIHHEEAWYIYAKPALKFWLGQLKNP